MDQVSNQMSLLVIAEIILFVVVLIFMPIYSCCVGKCRPDNEKDPPLKGLNMLEGSIRGMLALLSVGSFLIVSGVGASDSRNERLF